MAERVSPWRGRVSCTWKQPLWTIEENIICIMCIGTLYEFTYMKLYQRIRRSYKFTYMKSYKCIRRIYEFTYANPYRFLLSSLGSPNFSFSEKLRRTFG
jgi:hypothetical protein